MQALIIVDMQNDFMPGGPLPVKGADRIIPSINTLMEKFPLVVASKDWHPKNHISFAINSPGKKIGDIIQINGFEQKLWPIHCVAGTNGAAFAKGLHSEIIAETFYKGIDQKTDSYSSFFDNRRGRDTGLEKYLKKHDVEELGIVGVVTEICVFYTVLDALELGFEVKVFSDACRSIDEKAGKEALRKMEKKKGKIIKGLETC